MPRKSAAALAAVPIRPPTAARLRAPGDLAPEKRMHWLAVVEALPAGFIAAEQAQQLRSFCVHAALADDLATRLAALDPLCDEWPRLSAAMVSHSKSSLAFARSLRLTNQSRMASDAAARSSVQRGPASLELMRQRYGSGDAES